MDGTLLTEQGLVPEGFWPLLGVMQKRGITFVPASGRQYATLTRLFDEAHDGVSYVAENGNLVVHQGEPISTLCVDDATVQRVIAAVRTASSTRDIGLVVCGVRSAYVERSDEPFMAEVRKYYAKLEVVEDLTEARDSILKLAAFDFTDSEEAAPLFEEAAPEHQVVVSGKHWLDVMRDDVDKGRAVRALQEALDVTPAQTAVFGDYLNDLQMLDTADWSFAMANAHPDLKAQAQYLAPSNGEQGVVAVLTRLLG